jgi:ParB-like nuclease family protein
VTILALDRATNYHEPSRIDLELPTEVVDYYRVFPKPSVTTELVEDIALNGIKQPIRIYTNGSKGVLRDGHHRLVIAQQLGLSMLPVHLVPNWLEKTYVDYDLPELEPMVSNWLEERVDFTHQTHRTKRLELNKRLTQVSCSCGANWREVSREFVMGGPRI